VGPTACCCRVQQSESSLAPHHLLIMPSHLTCCSCCGKPFSSFSQLFFCTRCNTEIYCDAFCANYDVQNHKQVCSAMHSLNSNTGKITVYDVDKSVSTLSYKMLDDDQSVLRCMMLGGYKPLLKFLDASLTSGPMTQSNLHLIANLCAECPELRVPITLEGGSLFVIKALKAYMNHLNSILRESACNCLELLANNRWFCLSYFLNLSLSFLCILARDFTQRVIAGRRGLISTIQPIQKVS